MGNIPSGAAIRLRGGVELGRVLPQRAAMRGYIIAQFGEAPPVLVKLARAIYVARRFETAALREQGRAA